ncbi:hypothetical protein Slin15195_G108340 [Septoria linicola]|uniref:C2H2-type domain-containing protein n=1 Tax=Septoria linicola TaxID=215465 RepID=A0A9Q9AYL6_9PEZI|nr:hypothetical protein Slin14017_G106640 [Septoria linicola]USW57515.1 hypothetical protein Slin15195_G108340 [Septoria linicola]
MPTPRSSPKSSPIKASSLEQAIDTFPAPQLRKLLTHLVRISDDNHKIATERLLTPLSVVAGTKRKRWEVCVQCEKDFDVTMNEKQQCRRHPGSKEIDHRYDFWTDLNLELDGNLSDHAEETEYEDGFMWSCCEKPLASPGCVASEHRAGTLQKSEKKVKRSDSVVA